MRSSSSALPSECFAVAPEAKPSMSVGLAGLCGSKNVEAEPRIAGMDTAAWVSY